MTAPEGGDARVGLAVVVGILFGGSALMSLAQSLTGLGTRWALAVFGLLPLVAIAAAVLVVRRVS